jgi:hypothetical protein
MYVACERLLPIVNAGGLSMRSVLLLLSLPAIVLTIYSWAATNVSFLPGGVPAPEPGCHQSYSGACLDPNAGDYDCIGGRGDGPNFTGRVYVVGPDVFGLDRDGNGIGCE